MTRNPLSLLLEARGLNQSDLARAAGVSRQAASFWLSAGGIGGMRVANLQTLCRELGVAAAELMEPLPELPQDVERDLAVEFLWDGLYPGLLQFCAAVARGEDKALARLVQTAGLYRAARAAGAAVWRRFPEYRRYIHPPRREGLERLWRLERKARA